MPSILVTGTSAGIGEQIALYLLNKPDVNVIGVSRREAPTSITSNTNYKHIRGDVSQDDTIADIKNAIGNHLDGAIFNAGVLDAVQRIANVDLEAFKRVFDINLFSVVALTQAILPSLRAANGRAIYVSSGASTNAYQAWSAYGSSKAALNLFVSTLAVEEPDITAISIAPGVVDTPMQRSIRSQHIGSGEMSKEDAEKFQSLKSTDKLVDPRDSGALYGRLALSAKKELSGKYLRYNDPVLSE